MHTRNCPSWLLALALCACSSAPTRPPVDAVPAQDGLNAVAWQRRSAEYRLIAEQTYRHAAWQLDQALRDRTWDALPPADRDTPAADKPPAVIVDVDETVLDNGVYQARLLRDGRSFDSGSWAAWVREARATAVPGAVAFLRHARAQGVAVYFVTNRAEDLSAPTLANLRAVGIAVDDPAHILGRGTVAPGCDEGSEKHCRRRLVGRSHRVLLQIGDQRGDLVTATADLDRHRDWIGERWFLLPNPMYGHWESALFDHDWSLDASRRRQRKLDAIAD